MNARLVLLLALLAGVVLYSRRAGAAIESSSELVDPGSVAPGAVDPWAGSAPPMISDANVQAFLALIRSVEPGPGQYQALVGGGRFSDYTDHPAELGWPGIQTPRGRSTAAGAYQITRTTWRYLGGKARFGDFSPQAQDEAAIAILTEKRPQGLAAIEAGDFPGAIVALANEWEAFSKMLAGTYPVTLEQAAQRYADAGGAFA